MEIVFNRNDVLTFDPMDYEVMKTLMENYANGYTYYVPVNRSRNGRSEEHTSELQSH